MTEERRCAMCGSAIWLAGRCGLCGECCREVYAEDGFYACDSDDLLDMELARYRSLPSFTGRAT